MQAAFVNAYTEDSHGIVSLGYDKERLVTLVEKMRSLTGSEATFITGNEPDSKPFINNTALFFYNDIGILENSDLRAGELHHAALQSGVCRYADNQPRLNRGLRARQCRRAQRILRRLKEIFMLFTDKSHNNFAKDPAVIELDGYYYLYYSYFHEKLLNVGIARSKDGDDFTCIGSVEITQECEQKGIGAPAAIVIGGVVHLFYQTYGNGRLDAICHATSTDGVNFVKDAGNPIVAPREPYSAMPEWSCGRAIDADVCVFGDRLYLHFATRDKDFKRQIVGTAHAPLTSSFTRGDFTVEQELALEPTLDWEQACIEAPATLVEDGKLYMFYAGAYNCKPQQIGCAVSEDGVHFTRLFGEPLVKNGKPGDWNASESGHPYIYRANDGRIWLYYQGSPDGGKTWLLSRVEVGFEGGKPYLK